MFAWYQNSAKCYVFLSDVSTRKRPNDETTTVWQSAFRKSRWFTRGWTLQELLAPKIVEFYSRDRDLLGCKSSLEREVHEITHIPILALRGANLSDFDAHERMRWASKRNTKWVEDKTYCLLGIFGVHMPLIYGEGENAASRLQEEVLKFNRSRQDEFGQPMNIQVTDELNRQIAPNDPSKRADMTPDECRKLLLTSLSFEQMDSRRSTIKNAYSDTCQWLLKHPAYVEWTDPEQLPVHRGFLWINGKPGAGKSTLMKFAHAHANKTRIDGEIVTCFFFNARGDELERSTIGMYRALLAQLLNESTDLHDVLDGFHCASEPQDSRPVWTLEILCDLFSTAVTRLGQRRLKCFIDALDECDEQQVREMIAFFEEVGKNITKSGVQLYICFASRHYPAIDIQNGQQLTLEGENGHSEDLARYVRKKLRAGRGKATEDAKTKILEKANGIFMWVVLVVNILNDEFRRGRIFAVQKRLDEIPQEISSLLKAILRRDCTNMADLLLCLQWILFARRPLRREEFYFAMVSGLQSDPSVLTAWDDTHITIDSMDRFVLDCSKGLAELTKSKTPTVQFIHESVRDFLIKENGLCELWPTLQADLISLSHDRLKQCCQNYLRVDISSYVQSDSDIRPEAIVTKDCRQMLSTKFPFLEYAVKQVWYHADEAAIKVPQDDFLENFALGTWVRVNNLLERYDVRRYTLDVTLLYIFAENNFARLIRTLCRAGPEMGSRGERYKYPFFAALINDCRDAVRALLGQDENCDGRDITADMKFGRAILVPKFEDPFEWALHEGHEQVAEILAVSIDGKSTPLGGGWRRALFQAAGKGYEKIVDTILAADWFEFGKGGYRPTESLIASARNGHAGVVQRLLQRGINTEPLGGRYKTALHYAAANGHDGIVEQLLNHGAKVEAYDHEKCTALHQAADNGHESTVLLLLLHGANTEACNEDGMTPLLLAVKKGHDKAVEQLLEHRADTEAHDTRGKTALVLAVEHDQPLIIEQLLKHGANPEVYVGGFQTCLLIAVEKGRNSTIEQLLKHGADTEAYNARGETALISAAKNGQENIVLLLLNESADIEAMDKLGMTAFLWAAKTNNEVVAQALQKYGANIEKKDYGGSTALLQACEDVQTSTVSFLLNMGADIETVDSQGLTPLLRTFHFSHAVQNGNHALIDYYKQLVFLERENKKRLMMARQETATKQTAWWTDNILVDRGDTIRLLLDKNANIEAKDTTGKTALLLAAERGYEGNVKQLLDKGADIKAADDNGKTALLLASELGHLTVVQLLIDANANINTKDENGKTGLRLAAENGHTETAQLLLDKEANVGSVDDSGKTASVQVFQYGKETIVQLLVDIDNKPQTGDQQEKIRRSWTVKNSFEKIVAQLMIKCQDLVEKT